jgi:hypothetical protein
VHKIAKKPLSQNGLDNTAIDENRSLVFLTVTQTNAQMAFMPSKSVYHCILKRVSNLWLVPYTKCQYISVTYY